MPVVPAGVEGLVPDRLTVRWGKSAPVNDIEGFLEYLLEADGFSMAPDGTPGPRLEADVGDDFCHFTPDPDLWSMIMAEEMAIRLARCQSGEIFDGAERLLASADAESSLPWAALEAVGVMSLFRPRPPESPDMHTHPLIPLEDCKVSGVSFNEEQECVLDVYFDYWARPCAFLVEEDEEPVLVYRPMYRYRQAVFGSSELCKVTITAAPKSRIYGALGARGYKIGKHRVDSRYRWSLRSHDGTFALRTQTEEAWLTRSLPLWHHGDRLLLPAASDRDFTADDLLHRKEQHWDIVDAVWGQEWYVAARTDGSLDPFGRIYRADPTAALLDLPGLKPKEA